MRRIAAVLVVGSMLTIGLVPSGQGWAASGTTCTVEHVVTLDPGLSLQGSSGTFEDKNPETIKCDGPVPGATPTGSGSFHDQGRYGTKDPDGCLQGGEGEGSYSMVFPTADGEKTVVLPFALKFGDPSTGGNGPIGVHTKGDGWVGEFGATPVEGDCVTAPVTKVRVKGTVSFSS